MKRTFYLILAALLPIAALGQQTIHVAEAGTLPTLISGEEKYTITSLTVTGQLNGTDFALLRDMAGNNSQGLMTDGKLASLDLYGVDIVEGGEKYIDTKQIFLDEDVSVNSSKGFAYTTANGIMPQWGFVGCNSLRTIILPYSATEIGQMAFHECVLTSVTLPGNLQKIGRNAFYHNIHLTEVTLPASVTSIDANAFAYCGNLTKVYATMPVPCTIAESVFSVYDKATLYVPTGCRETYAATTPWNKFAKIEEFAPTEIRAAINENKGKVTNGVYDLQGCMMPLQHLSSNRHKGLYVVDGRKVIVVP